MTGTDRLTTRGGPSTPPRRVRRGCSRPPRAPPRAPPLSSRNVPAPLDRPPPTPTPTRRAARTRDRATTPPLERSGTPRTTTIRFASSSSAPATPSGLSRRSSISLASSGEMPGVSARSTAGNGNGNFVVGMGAPTLEDDRASRPTPRDSPPLDHKPPPLNDPTGDAAARVVAATPALELAAENPSPAPPAPTSDEPGPNAFPPRTLLPRLPRLLPTLPVRCVNEVGDAPGSRVGFDRRVDSGVVPSEGAATVARPGPETSKPDANIAERPPTPVSPKLDPRPCPKPPPPPPRYPSSPGYPGLTHPVAGFARLGAKRCCGGVVAANWCPLSCNISSAPNCPRALPPTLNPPRLFPRLMIPLLPPTELPGAGCAPNRFPDAEPPRAESSSMTPFAPWKLPPARCCCCCCACCRSALAAAVCRARSIPAMSGLCADPSPAAASAMSAVPGDTTPGWCAAAAAAAAVTWACGMSTGCAPPFCCCCCWSACKFLSLLDPRRVFPCDSANRITRGTVPPRGMRSLAVMTALAACSRDANRMSAPAVVVPEACRRRDSTMAPKTRK